MARVLPILLAAILVIAGFVAGITAFAGRDEAGFEPGTTAPQPASSGRLPAGISPGNVVINYRTGAAHRAVDAIADELGAADTPASRAAGQAIIPRPDREQAVDLVVITHSASRSFPDARDPAVTAYVRANLGRID